MTLLLREEAWKFVPRPPDGPYFLISLLSIGFVERDFTTNVPSCRELKPRVKEDTRSTHTARCVTTIFNSILGKGALAMSWDDVGRGCWRDV
jgi:hypothetical protein